MIFFLIFGEILIAISSGYMKPGSVVSEMVAVKYSSRQAVDVKRSAATISMLSVAVV